MKMLFMKENSKMSEPHEVALNLLQRSDKLK